MGPISWQHLAQEDHKAATQQAKAQAQAVCCPFSTFPCLQEAVALTLPTSKHHAGHASHPETMHSQLLPASSTPAAPPWYARCTCMHLATRLTCIHYFTLTYGTD
jgi:hypothetical protein